MTSEILFQDTRTRMYRHANRPMPLQNIRLNLSDNPYHKVIRGNTYQLRNNQNDYPTKRQYARKPRLNAQPRRGRYHDPDGPLHYSKKSLTIQTDQTELVELVPEVDNATTQTEADMDPDRIVVTTSEESGSFHEAIAVGVDKSTQICPDDPEIFEFDKDVVEILEKIVGTIMVQSMGEVLEEEEVSSITKQKNHHKVRMTVLLGDRPET